MDIKGILKTILEREGPITITPDQIKKAQAQDIGIIETWDDKGNKTFTLYTHQARSK